MQVLRLLALLSLACREELIGSLDPRVRQLGSVLKESKGLTPPVPSIT